MGKSEGLVRSHGPYQGPGATDEEIADEIVCPGGRLKRLLFHRPRRLQNWCHSRVLRLFRRLFRRLFGRLFRRLFRRLFCRLFWLLFPLVFPPGVQHGIFSKGKKAGAFMAVGSRGPRTALEPQAFCGPRPPGP